MTQSQDKVAVAVLGSGPAGSATALCLARSGIATCLIERCGTEVLKAGEGLPPAARPYLAKLGLWERFLQDGHQPCYGNKSAWGSAQIAENDFIFNTNGHGWHLNRNRFDQMLVEAAVESGARLFRTTRIVRSRPIGDEGWELELLSAGTTLRLKAAIVVDASGRASGFARPLGARRITYDNLIGVTAILRPSNGSRLLDSSTFVESVPNGWWYSALLSDSTIAAAYFTDADHPSARLAITAPGWMKLARESAHLRARLDIGAYRFSGPPRLLAANSSCLNSSTGDNWLAVGDAAQSHDPLSSQGILAALNSAALAFPAIQSRLAGEKSAWSAYSATLTRDYHRYLAERTAYYRIETRWPSSQFWRRRSGDEDQPGTKGIINKL